MVGTAPVGRIWVWATYGNFSSFVSSFMDLKERRKEDCLSRNLLSAVLLLCYGERWKCTPVKIGNFTTIRLGSMKFASFSHGNIKYRLCFSSCPRPVFSTRFPKGRKSSIELPGAWFLKL